MYSNLADASRQSAANLEAKGAEGPRRRIAMTMRMTLHYTLATLLILGGRIGVLVLGTRTQLAEDE